MSATLRGHLTTLLVLAPLAHGDVSAHRLGATADSYVSRPPGREAP